MKKLFLLTFISFVSLSILAQDTITIRGHVTDFEGNPVDSALVELKYADFSTAHEAYSNEKGEYTLNVLKGRYIALNGMRWDEYPRLSKNEEQDQRLEYWAWNIIADKDMVIDIPYHRLEIYGISAFCVEGGYPGYMVYCRPMGLTKFQEDPNQDLNINLEDLEISMTLDGVDLKINSRQRVDEYVGGNEFTGYLFHVDIPIEDTDKPYRLLKIRAKDLSNGDKGEGLYFLENSNYKRKL